MFNLVSQSMSCFGGSAGIF